ncbi:MAG: AmmeMemoRadiSam system radical SAM enzyme [Gammaproteobacteria bacterium]|nr:MAG: AmmeMemoRadiSam system radical SAM enzyme [Gammaproteobacteria bacterium]
MSQAPVSQAPKEQGSGPAPGAPAARYWHRLPDGRLQCDLCPRYCKLRDGQAGLCFVRRRQGEGMVLSTYGRSSGYCVDPIEKKPLYHFLPGTPVLSFGTAGCNLACKFCQNWDMSKAREMDVLADQAPPELIAAAARELGCSSVAYTYNDPVIFLEYAVDTAQACREQGVRSVAVTAGYITAQAREEFFRHMDAANVDLKAFSERFYRKVCGAELAPVLETLEYLARETSVWLELTTLLIPGENDSPEELEAMAAWVAERLGPDVPWHFTAFHPDWKMRDRPPTPLRTLLRARRIAKEAGMRFVYTGNVHHEETDSTFCPGCGARLIGRDWYQITSWGLDEEGRCRACGTALPGRFQGPPGRWGRRRLPVRLAASA